MIFELKNINEAGRSILHRAALNHKSEEMGEVLKTIFEQQVKDNLPPITKNDIFGNTPLALACIKRSLIENLNDRKE